MGKKVDIPGAVKDGQHKGRPGPSTRNKVSVNLLRIVKVFIMLTTTSVSKLKK